MTYRVFYARSDFSTDSLLHLFFNSGVSSNMVQSIVRLKLILLNRNQEQWQ